MLKFHYLDIILADVIEGTVSRMPTSTHNEPTSRLESIDFNTSDWDRIRNSLNLVDWNAELDHLDTESVYNQFVIPLLCFVIQTQN